VLPGRHELTWPYQRRGCPRCRRDSVVELAAAAGPSLPRPVIEAAVDAVVTSPAVLRELTAALAAGPGALICGAPPVAGRLATELIARGSVTLTVPACAACGRTGMPLFRGDNGEGVCQRCRAWQRAGPCATCGKVKPVTGRNSAGQPVCEVCHRRGGPARHRQCGACGKAAPVAVRARNGAPDICVNCYRLPEATCSKCQRRRPCTVARTSQPVCPSCSLRAAAGCARCGQHRPPQARWPEGPVCDPCYRAALSHRGPCTGCGRTPRLVAPPGLAAGTCADCAGIPVTSACADCRIEDKLYEKGRCNRCSLRRRTRELLSAGTGTIPPQFAGVFDAVTAARQPRSALNWLRQGAGASLPGPAADRAADVPDPGALGTPQPGQRPELNWKGDARPRGMERSSHRRSGSEPPGATDLRWPARPAPAAVPGRSGGPAAAHSTSSSTPWCCGGPATWTPPWPSRGRRLGELVH